MIVLVITINLISVLKFYLLGSVFGLVYFYILIDKNYFKNKLKSYKGIKEILQSQILCFLFSWVNMYWIHIDFTDSLCNYFVKKNKPFLSAVFHCLSERWFSKTRILRVYYNNYSGHYTRIRKHYYNSYRLKNKYDYFDNYNTYVEDRFVKIYVDKILRVKA